MSIEHIVLIETKERASHAAISEVLDAIRGLKNKISGILDIKVGKNISQRMPKVTYVVIVTMSDQSVLDAYGPHPAHQEVLALLENVAENWLVADMNLEK